jgi:hypothetical protein
MFLREAMPEGPSSLLPTLSIKAFCAALAAAVGGPVTFSLLAKDLIPLDILSAKDCFFGAFGFDFGCFSFGFGLDPPVFLLGLFAALSGPTKDIFIPSYTTILSSPVAVLYTSFTAKPPLTADALSAYVGKFNRLSVLNTAVPGFCICCKYREKARTTSLIYR